MPFTYFLEDCFKEFSQSLEKHSFFVKLQMPEKTF